MPGAGTVPADVWQRWMPAAALFAVLLIIASTSLRLFGVEYPLLIDLPNQLARHAVQCSGDQPGD